VVAPILRVPANGHDAVPRCYAANLETVIAGADIAA